MSFPAARVGDTTATGDAILPPGTPNVLIGGQPAACVGDTVYGPVINYAPGIIISGASSVFINGRPVARVSSPVMGLTIGPLGVPVPVSTVVKQGASNVLIGDSGAALSPPPQVQAQLKAMEREVAIKQAEAEAED